MKNLILALATFGSLAVAIPASVETASAATRVVVRHGVVRPLMAPRRCVMVTRVVRGPRGVVRRVTERRCR
jgi:hypothetical protein